MSVTRLMTTVSKQMFVWLLLCARSLPGAGNTAVNKLRTGGAPTVCQALGRETVGTNKHMVLPGLSLQSQGRGDRRAVTNTWKIRGEGRTEVLLSI